jgi:hypothetical protein
MRRIARTSAVFVAAIACLSFSADAASMASAATVHPSSHALKVSSNVAPEAVAQASGAVPRLADSPGVQIAPAAKGAIICQGDVCIQSNCAKCDSQNIEAWANTYTFTGHFQINWGCGPGCETSNSPNKRWIHGGAGYSFDGIPYGVSACVIAWEGPYNTGSRWRSIGDVCFSDWE